MDDAKAINLKLGIQVILGLPSETLTEALGTIRFLLEHPEIDAIFSIFYLIPNTKVFNQPEKYGIQYDKNMTAPFKYSYEYKHVSGEVDRTTAKDIIDFYWDCKKKNIMPRDILKEFKESLSKDE